MFGIGLPELLLILAVALVVLGPKRLPELAKSLGRGLAELKKTTSDLKQNIDLGDEFKQVQQDFQEVKSGLQDIADTALLEAPAADYLKTSSSLEKTVVKAPPEPEKTPDTLATVVMNAPAFPETSSIELHSGADDILEELAEAADRTYRDQVPYPPSTTSS